MNISKLKNRATEHGILTTTYTTATKLVRRIQRKEGSSSCFRSDERDLCSGGCEWEDSCKDALVAAWRR